MTIKQLNRESSRDLYQFIQFPNQLYRNNIFFIPSLTLSVKWMLSNKNPFFQHSDIALFVAIENNRIVGRIAAIFNKTHVITYQDNTGFFGFFDSINDLKVAQNLIDSAFFWLKSKGLYKMLGPTNLTTNDSCGILIDGFDQTPMALMPYNFDYYKTLLESCGLTKAEDLYSYSIDGSGIFKKYRNVFEKISNGMESNQLKVRPVSQKRFQEDIRQIQRVYNLCNQNNWGFMPLNDSEFKEMAKDLKRIAPLDLALVLEHSGTIVGFIIAIPNINEMLYHVPKGNLFPFGWLKMLQFKNKIKSARILILGIDPEFQAKGYDLIMYQRIKESLNNLGIFQSEACYVMENNVTMQNIIEKLDGKIVKKYRIYSI
jgi:hypothetical protein